MYMKVSDKMKFEFRAELPMLCRSKGDHSNYLFLTGVCSVKVEYFHIRLLKKFGGYDPFKCYFS